jgi:protein-tyrosine phosphatase
MYDLHNHILPQLDDGAHDLDEALAMAQSAAAIGTRVMAATPHRFPYGVEIMPERVLREAQIFQTELNRRGIGLTVVPGFELTMTEDLPALFESGRLFPLGGFASTAPHALVESPFSPLPPFALDLMKRLLEVGVTPIIAHPERNSEVQADLAFVEAAAALGCVIQLTALSVLGAIGKKPLNVSKAIVAHREWKIIIASDAHWIVDRTCDKLAEAAEAAGGWLGDPARGLRMVNEDAAACLALSA